VVVEYLSGSMN